MPLVEATGSGGPRHHGRQFFVAGPRLLRLRRRRPAAQRHGTGSSRRRREGAHVRRRGPELRASTAAAATLVLLLHGGCAHPGPPRRSSEGRQGGISKAALLGSGVRTCRSNCRDDGMANSVEVEIGEGLLLLSLRAGSSWRLWRDCGGGFVEVAAAAAAATELRFAFAVRRAVRADHARVGRRRCWHRERHGYESRCSGAA
jgi:hypothetical protein